MVVDPHGQRKITLKRGERKAVHTDRIIMVPGPEAEVEVVRWIYEAFVKEGNRQGEIAGLLNARGIVSVTGRRWQYDNVHSVLQNEKYIGNLIYARTRSTLKTNPS